MSRVKYVFVSLLPAIVCAAALPETSNSDAANRSDRALSVLIRTKTTSATYARYAWNKITPPDKATTEGWSAEFNDGPMHRVETPRDRLIANCVERSGAAYSVSTGQTFSGPGVAGTACGINTNKQITSIRYVGRVVDRVGEADRVEVTDADNIRTYDVTRDGILIRTVFALNTPEKPIVLDEETVAVLRELPRQNMFDATSLSQSVVPDAYKKPPAIWP